VCHHYKRMIYNRGLRLSMYSIGSHVKHVLYALERFSGKTTVGEKPFEGMKYSV
jgi:hypothetical protein